MRIHTTLRVLREKTGMSQTELAEALSRAQPEVSMWEWGKEKMPAQIRQAIWAILRDRLGAQASRLQPEDLDRPYDEVLVEWNAVAAPSTTVAVTRDARNP